MSVIEHFDSRKARSTSWLHRLAANLGLSNGNANLRETLERAVAEADADGEDPLPTQERAMIVNVLGFAALKVSEVSIPRVDIVAVSADATLKDLLRTFRESGHSRVPVYGENLDDVIGMVHIKDLTAWIGNRLAEGTLAGLDADLAMTVIESGLRKDILYVPTSMTAVDLLAKMRADRVHLAIVVDEFGGTDGLVSMEDLMEEIVGDISDEHDRVQDCVLKGDPSGFVASARTPVEVVEQALGVSLRNPDDATDDVDTLGGLIMALEGSMPKKGQVIEHPSGISFEIVDATARRIEKVRIRQAATLPNPQISLQLALPAPDHASPRGEEPAHHALNGVQAKAA
jgi:CBS domain containing-hemolysin-like protein